MSLEGVRRARQGCFGRTTSSYSAEFVCWSAPWMRSWKGRTWATWEGSVQILRSLAAQVSQVKGSTQSDSQQTLLRIQAAGGLASGARQGQAPASEQRAAARSRKAPPAAHQGRGHFVLVPSDS